MSFILVLRHENTCNHMFYCCKLNIHSSHSKFPLQLNGCEWSACRRERLDRPTKTLLSAWTTNGLDVRATGSAWQRLFHHLHIALKFERQRVLARSHTTLSSDSVCRTTASDGWHPPSSEIKQDASTPLFLPAVRRADPASLSSPAASQTRRWAVSVDKRSTCYR